MAMLLVFGLSSMALAVPYMPPLGPLFLKFNNVEQLSPTEAIVAPSGMTETNWGVFDITSISTGDISTNPQNFPSDTMVWSQLTSTGEITGIFGNIQLHSIVGSTFNSKGGSLYLYWDDTPDAALATALPSERGFYSGGDFDFKNFAADPNDTFLAQIDFMPGAIVDWITDPTKNITITGTSIPTAGGFTGIANSFGNVADVNNDGVIDSADGLWATLLDSNYFDTEWGRNTADLKFRNIYENSGAHSWDATNIFGADSTDPARAYGVPEPATMLLLGTGLIGLAGFGRKKKFFKKD